MVRSYELGVLFLPGLEEPYSRSASAFGFDAPTATAFPASACKKAIEARNDAKEYQPITLGLPVFGSPKSSETYKPHRFSFSTVSSTTSAATETSAIVDTNVVELPLPYSLPPPRYDTNDKPWVVDDIYRSKDALGQTSLTMQVHMYGHYEPPDDVD